MDALRFKVGTMVELQPVDSTAVLHFVVTHSNYSKPPFGAVQLWNGVHGDMSSRPYLIEQPDGTWTNTAGEVYRLREAK